MATLTNQSANSTTLTNASSATSIGTPELLIEGSPSSVFLLIDSVYSFLISEVDSTDIMPMTNQAVNATTLTNQSAS